MSEQLYWAAHAALRNRSDFQHGQELAQEAFYNSSRAVQTVKHGIRMQPMASCPCFFIRKSTIDGPGGAVVFELTYGGGVSLSG